MVTKVPVGIVEPSLGKSIQALGPVSALPVQAANPTMKAQTVAIRINLGNELRNLIFAS
jgi:hypothetical protein